MSLKLSHIAIAHPKISEISAKLEALSLFIKENHEVPTEKVRAAMIPVSVSEQFRLELLEPTAVDSPIANFLSKRPGGGIHHISFEVEQLEKWEAVLKKNGFEVWLQEYARPHGVGLSSSILKASAAYWSN